MKQESEAYLIEQGAKLAGDLVRTLVNRPGGKKQKPAEFPEQKAALLKLGHYTDPSVLDNDDVMVRVGERLYLITTAGNVFEQLSDSRPSTISATLASSTSAAPQIVERKNLDRTTLEYQEQLLYNELWLSETHAKEDFHGCSTDVHCGFKHGLNLVALATETKSMTNDPMWQKIEDMGNDMMVKAHPSRVEQGHYEEKNGRDVWMGAHHDEYSVLAIRIGELRKEMGNRVMARRKPAAPTPSRQYDINQTAKIEALNLPGDLHQYSEGTLRFYAALLEMDQKRPRDYDYRSLLSTYSKDSLRPGETWRGRMVKVILSSAEYDVKNGRHDASANIISVVNKLLGKIEKPVIASNDANQPGTITLEKAKKLAAEQAAAEIEKAWDSQKKR